MDIYYDIVIFILGTIIGSFLNVCIYRIPKGGSAYCYSRNFGLFTGDKIFLLYTSLIF